MIKSKDISVVVQGAVDIENTPLCLKSIRKYLPDAQIILSTWEGSDVEGLDYDILVLNSDPGAPDYVRSDGAITPCNINRLLVSTYRGLQKANRKYALKLRSDLYLSDSNFLKYFKKYTLRNDKYVFFEQKVIISSVYTKLTSHINNMPVCYHPTDWLFFGLRNDLLTYFDIPLANEENFFKWKFKNPLNNPYPKCQDRYFIEQYYFINAFSKKFNLNYDDITCWSAYSINLWKQLLVNNFIVLDLATLKIYSSKHVRFKKFNNGIDKSFKGLIWQSDYKRMYKQIFKNNNQNNNLNNFKSLTPKDFGFVSKSEKVKRKLKKIFQIENSSKRFSIKIGLIKISHKK